MKHCIFCKKEIDNKEYYCSIKCKKEKYKRQWREGYYKYREKILEKRKIQRNNKQYKEHMKVYYKDYYKKNYNRLREQHAIYRKKNQDIIRKKDKENWQKNYIEIRRKRRLWGKQKYNNNINFRLVIILRTRFKAAIANNSKCESILKLIGCTIPELKNYLQKQFISGMSWSNYGYYGWHIDHIIPCCKFDLSKEEEQRKCFHYSNLQPLWWYKNFEKANKII